MMRGEELVGRCGIYCGACIIYRAERDHEQARNDIAQRHQCRLDEVRCQGCGGLTEACWCHGCKILACLNKQGYRYCHECPSFHDQSCEIHQHLADIYTKIGVDLRHNLLRIQQGSLDQWLEEQDQLHRCHACHHPLSVWDTSCPSCGQKIKQ